MKYYIKNPFLIFLLLLICNSSLKAQSFTSPFNHLTTLEGLPNNGIRAILRDSTGFIWFGTKAGLGRFDGYEIKNCPSLSDKEIWSLEELDSETLLIGTSSKLFSYNRKTNNLTQIASETDFAIVKAIKKIDDNTFFVGSEQGLFIISKQTDIQKILLDGGTSSSNHITAIAKDENNIFWFSTANGLGRYDVTKRSTSFYKMDKGVNNSNFFNCLSITGSDIYLGSNDKGVFSFNTNSSKFNKIEAFRNDIVLSMDNDSKNLYVGTDGKGVLIYSIKNQSIDTEISRKKSPANPIKSNTITALKIYDNILWLGTSFIGVHYNPPASTRFSSYKNDKIETSEYNVRSFFHLKDGDMLIGTRSGLLYVSEEKDIVKELTTNNSILRSDIIIYIAEIDDKVMIATYGGGVYIFNKGSLTLSDFSQNEPFLHGRFFHFLKDRSGNLWFATTEGLYSTTTEGEILKKYDITNSRLTNNTILFLCLDSSDRLWLATHAGLCLMEIETGMIKSNIFDKKHNQILNFIKYILEDSRKNLWFCTNHGILKVDSNLNPQEYYTEDNFLPESIVNSAIEDNDGNIWFTTSRQLLKYNVESKTFYTFQNLGGLTIYDFNNNVGKTSDGTIWWANEGGLLYANQTEKNDINSTIKYYPTITSYYISNIEYDPSVIGSNDKLKIPASQNNIRIKFSYLNYSLPYLETFEYMLEGYDKEWQKQIGKNEVVYSDLPVGEYVFKLRAPNDYSKQTKLSIKVERSYTSIIWISVLIVVSIALFIFFFYQLKKLRVKMKKERLILSNVQEQSKATGTLSVSEEKVETILDALMSYMQTNKPYLNSKLKIKDIAEKLNCSTSELSQILNIQLGVNFTDFINVYRVNELKSMLKDQQNLSKFTLRGLSERCGFNSKTTFYRVFKKVTGKTPLEYCKENQITIREE